MTLLAERLVSLAKQQRRSAGMYAEWARDGGKYTGRWTAEAIKLRRDARWNLAWARRDRQQDQHRIEAAE